MKNLKFMCDYYSLPRSMQLLSVCLVLMLSSCQKEESTIQQKEEVSSIQKISDREYLIETETTIEEVRELVNEQYGNAEELSKDEILKLYDVILYDRVARVAGVTTRSLENKIWLKSQVEHQPTDSSPTTLLTVSYFFSGGPPPFSLCPSSTVFAYATTKVPEAEGDYRYLARTVVIDQVNNVELSNLEYEEFNFSCGHKVELNAFTQYHSDCSYSTSREINCDD